MGPWWASRKGLTTALAILHQAPAPKDAVFNFSA